MAGGKNWPGIDVIKLFLEEIQIIQISSKAKTEIINHFKSNKQFQSIGLLKIAYFQHFCACLDIITNFMKFLNIGEIQIFSIKSFITSTTEMELGENIKKLRNIQVGTPINTRYRYTYIRQNMRQSKLGCDCVYVIV